MRLKSQTRLSNKHLDRKASLLVNMYLNPTAVFLLNAWRTEHLTSLLVRAALSQWGVKGGKSRARGRAE